LNFFKAKVTTPPPPKYINEIFCRKSECLAWEGQDFNPRARLDQMVFDEPAMDSDICKICMEEVRACAQVLFSSKANFNRKVAYQQWTLTFVEWVIAANLIGTSSWQESQVRLGANIFFFFKIQ